MHDAVHNCAARPCLHDEGRKEWRISAGTSQYTHENFVCRSQVLPWAAVVVGGILLLLRSASHTDGTGAYIASPRKPGTLLLSRQNIPEIQGLEYASVMPHFGFLCYAEVAPGYDAFLNICKLFHLNVAAFGCCDAPNRLHCSASKFSFEPCVHDRTQTFLGYNVCTSHSTPQMRSWLTQLTGLRGCVWQGDEPCGYGSLPGHWVGSLGVLDTEQLAAAPPQWQTFDPHCQLAPLLGSILNSGAGACAPAAAPPPLPTPTPSLSAVHRLDSSRSSCEQPMTWKMPSHCRLCGSHCSSAGPGTHTVGVVIC